MFLHFTVLGAILFSLMFWVFALFGLPLFVVGSVAILLWASAWLRTYLEGK